MYALVTMSATQNATEKGLPTNVDAESTDIFYPSFLLTLGRGNFHATVPIRKGESVLTIQEWSAVFGIVFGAIKLGLDVKERRGKPPRRRKPKAVKPIKA
jgi:hypothetical protein